MRLIDADAKIMAQLYDDEHEEWIQKEMTVADYLSFSDTSIPFVDAVPVVRCADCKWLQCNMRPDGHLPNGVDEYECRHWCGGCDPTDFCSYGERKDGADNA